MALERPTIRELLESGADPRQPGDALRILAALDARDVEPEEVDRVLEAVCAIPVPALHAWWVPRRPHATTSAALCDRIRRAAAALARHRLGHPLQRVLAEIVAELEACMGAAATQEDVRAWYRGELPPERAATVASACAVAGECRDEYRALIAARDPVVFVECDTRWSPWEIEPVACIPIPHRGAGARVEVWHTARGLEWRGWQGRSDVISASQASYPWGDPTTGPVETRIVRVPADLGSDLRFAAKAAWAALASPDAADTPRRVLGLIDGFREGAPAVALHDAARAVCPPASAAADVRLAARGEVVAFPGRPRLPEARHEPEDDHAELVALVFELRAVLEAVAHEIRSDAIDLALGEIDDLHARHGVALAWLTDAHHDQIVSDTGLAPDPGCWWGWRDGPGSSVGHTDILAWLTEPSVSSGADGLAAAPAQAPHAEVAIPLLLTRHGRGHVCWLRVGHGYGLWGREPRFGVEAERAVYDAWLAAGTLTDSRLPARPYHDHQITVERHPSPGVQIDGPSLGLPMALAFAALWGGASGRIDVFATGAVSRDGVVGAIADADLKAQTAFEQHGAVRILVPPHNVEHVDHPSVAALSVSSLRAAARRAGIDTAGTRGHASWSRAWAVKIIDETIAAIRGQEPDPEAEIHGSNPWTRRADRLDLAIRVIGDSEAVRHREAVARARVWECIATLLSGRAPQADERFGPDVDTALATLPDLRRRALRAMVWSARLAAAIQQSDWTKASALNQQNVDVLPDLTGEALGYAAGTLGRYHYICAEARDLPKAIALLEQSIQGWELACRDQEIPRSLLYLAQAHRLWGDAHGATRHLLEAETRVNQLVEDGLHYGLTTRMYVDYELGRQLLATGDLDDAAFHLGRAWHTCGQLGWGPERQVLRSLTLLARARGDHVAEADWLLKLERMERTCEWHDEVVREARTGVLTLVF